jgi:serine phosphatase RsbU (regulator of sigma subunit)
MHTTGIEMGRDDAPSSGEVLRLVVIEENQTRTIVLDHFPFSIGRLSDRDLVIEDGRVSREHAQLTQEPDGIYLINQSTKRGTFVNGERVARHKLTRNDRVDFGLPDGPCLVFHPDRPSSGVVQRLLGQLSTRKQPASASDLGVLNLFIEAARNLNASQVLEEVLQTLLDASLRLTLAQRGFVFLLQEDGELHLAAGLDERGEKIDDISTISRSALNDALQSASEFLVTDLEDMAKIAGRKSVQAYSLRTVICIPLRKMALKDKEHTEVRRPERKQVHGVLYLDSHFLSGKLSKVRSDILHTIADEAARLLENVALVQAEDAARRVREELKMAADIQRHLMPVPAPDLPYARINAVSFPCKDVGGDFFDLVYSESGLSLVVADIAGKGMPAAVLASTLQGMLHSQLAIDLPLPKIIGAANRFLCERIGPPRFATLVIARLQNNGEVELLNCGHVWPLLISGGVMTRLEHGNLPVGLRAATDFEATRLQMKPGDRLLVVTDGVTEAENADGEFFGNERLEAYCSRGVEGILGAVNDFRGNAPVGDDYTIAEIIYE